MSFQKEQFDLVLPANVLGAGLTKQVVTKETWVTGHGSRALRVDVKVKDVVAGAGITAIVQHASTISGWVDTKSVSITGDGTFSVTFLDSVAADQTHLPLRPKLRVVITTGAGSAVTVEAVSVMQEAAGA